MIPDEKYKSLLDNGLILDHYFLLCNIKNDIKPVDSKRIQGFFNLLTKKGYIEDDKLTEKGLKLVETGKEEKFDYGEWVLKLYADIQDKLVELTGKKQVMSQVKLGTKSYPFLENVKTLNDKLTKVISTYKLRDYEVIEKAIMKYIQECNDSDHWFPQLHYWILKDGGSRMITAIENAKDEEEEEKQDDSGTQKFL